MVELFAKLRGLLFYITCKIMRKNIYIGKRLKVYKKFSVHGKGKISIGDDCVIAGIVGDHSQHVCLDTDSENATIIIGNNVKLYATRIHARFFIKIGNDVTIEESGIADTDYHSIEANRSLPSDETIEKCRVEIGNQVHIGARSFITKGVKIGGRARVWPGSIVTSSIKKNISVCGNPARPVRF